MSGSKFLGAVSFVTAVLLMFLAGGCSLAYVMQSGDTQVLPAVLIFFGIPLFLGFVSIWRRFNSKDRNSDEFTYDGTVDYNDSDRTKKFFRSHLDRKIDKFFLGIFLFILYLMSVLFEKWLVSLGYSYKEADNILSYFVPLIGIIFVVFLVRKVLTILKNENSRDNGKVYSDEMSPREEIEESEFIPELKPGRFSVNAHSSDHEDEQGA